MSHADQARGDDLRVAIVGAGPAGFYVAGHLLRDAPSLARVDVFDRLPTPWGLVRSGVAPDHPKIKSVSRIFEKTASDERFRFFGNIELGTHLSASDLRERYDAVVYAVGAQSERRLGIPGEDLPGSHGAAEFVGWYNGHPDHTDAGFDLSAERALIVGNGNVSIDVARMLCSDVAELGRTDAADHAIEALVASAVRHVVICGRRGPDQAAFTTPELKELGQMAGVSVVAHVAEVGVTDTDPLNRNVSLLRQFASTGSNVGSRTIEFRFFRSPVAIHGDGRVEAVELAVNELVDDGAGIRARDTGRRETVACGLVVRAVGYRGVGFADVPFDPSTGCIPNQAGRVVTDTGVARGEYCVGWIKRGPTGIIGTNKQCATETVTSLLADLAAGGLNDPIDRDDDSIGALLLERGATVVDQSAWLRIDAHERQAGERSSRPRVKLCRREDLLDRAGLVLLNVPAVD